MKKTSRILKRSTGYLAAAGVLLALFLYNHIRVGGSYALGLDHKHVSFWWVKPSEIHSISQFVDIRVAAKVAFFTAVGWLLALAFHQLGVKKRWVFWLTAAVLTVSVDLLYLLTYSFGIGPENYIIFNLNSWINCFVGFALGYGLFCGMKALWNRFLAHLRRSLLEEGLSSSS